MATHLDLEEQEQLDQLKHFWKQYGNPITWLLIVVLAGFAGWNFYNYWQRSQATQASGLYDEVDRAVQSGDLALVERAMNDIKDKYGSTTYAQQAVLLGSKTLYEKGKPEEAKAGLTWVAEKGGDAGYKAIARLRLASIQVEAKAYDDALKTLASDIPKEFEGLADDRRGDIYFLQGKRAEALAEFQKAYAKLDATSDYRRLLEVKINSLGAVPTGKPGAAEASK